MRVEKVVVPVSGSLMVGAAAAFVLWLSTGQSAWRFVATGAFCVGAFDRVLADSSARVVETILGEARIASDIIAFDKTLPHVYVPGAESGTMAILGLSPAGDPSVLGIARAAHGQQVRGRRRSPHGVHAPRAPRARHVVVLEAYYSGELRPAHPLGRLAGVAV